MKKITVVRVFGNSYAGNVNSISLMTKSNKEYRISMIDFEKILKGKTIEVETETPRKYEYITKIKTSIKLEM